MKQEIKVVIGIIIVTIVIIVGAALLVSQKPAAMAATANPAYLLKPNSHATRPLPVAVTVVEFGDYQCPACGAAFPVVEQVKAYYKDNPNVSFVFRNFPLSQHPNALPAAYAAEAAANQGQFWQMNYALYSKQSEWADNANPQALFSAYAKNLGLDVTKFEADEISDAVHTVVANDLADAQALNLQGTPTFVINGVFTKDIPSYNEWLQLINAQLTLNKKLSTG